MRNMVALVNKATFEAEIPLPEPTQATLGSHILTISTRKHVLLKCSH